VTVFVADEQEAVRVDCRRLERLAAFVLVDQRVPRAMEVAVLCVDRDTITSLNRQHMGAEGPTDVLAFPIDDDMPEVGRSPDAGSTGPDRPPLEPSEVPLLLGDILICPAVAKRNATELGRALRDEMALLVVHGALHVLGMDHVDEEETRAMQARERELLAQLHEQP